MEAHQLRPDVTVIGGGLAGVAASIHLATEGMRVICIEPAPDRRHVVGESLDWAAPALLSDLGLSAADLVNRNIATYKKHVTLQVLGGAARRYGPSDWVSRPPFNVDLRALHVDRTPLDYELLQIALRAGVSFIRDKVVEIERAGKRVTAVHTDLGTCISSAWFLDASGSSSSLFGREFNLPRFEYGPTKVAMWAHFKVPAPSEGTTIYADSQDAAYLEWIWEIPINADTVSVGYVGPGESIKRKRKSGQTVLDIYSHQLSKHARLNALLPTAAPMPYVTSFRNRVYGQASGPNWLIIGEAASLVDPMTSNGVTAALRHAAEASGLIVRCRNKGRLPWIARFAYSQRVMQMGRIYNSGIENVMYDWPIRSRVGALASGELYTIPAWTINAIYSRVKPSGILSALSFAVALGLIRAGAFICHWICKRAPLSKPGHRLLREPSSD